jgi:hypothetical protein
MWKAHPEDLSLRIHPFYISETSPDAIAQLQELAQKFYLISLDGASSSHTNAQELVGVEKGLNPPQPYTLRRPKPVMCSAAQSVLWQLPLAMISSIYPVKG